MDKLSPADLLELTILSESVIDYQLELWLTVSFATIVACFAGRNLLSNKMRWIVSSLYLLATIAVVSRIYYLVLDLWAYSNALVSLGIDSNIPIAMSVARITLFIAGTGTTIYFVHHGSKDKNT